MIRLPFFLSLMHTSLLYGAFLLIKGMCLLCSTQPHCFIEGNKERKKERDLHSVPETKYHQFMVEWLRRNICLQSRLRTTHDLHIKDSKSGFMHLHKMFYLFFVKQQQQQLNM